MLIFLIFVITIFNYFLFDIFRSRTIYIVTGSYWIENVYNLSASTLGWTTIAIVIGEVTGLILVQLFAWRVKLWVSSLSCLSSQLLMGSLPLLVLTRLYGNDIGGYVGVAIIIIILLAIGHESFYVIQQTNAINYSPLPRYTSMLLMAERTSQEIGAIFALWLTAKLWISYPGDFILLFAIVWTIATCLEFSILFIYRKRNGRNTESQEIEEV